LAAKHGGFGGTAEFIEKEGIVLPNLHEVWMV
jgi:hypothetical protein